jgi:hypothetical protein
LKRIVFVWDNFGPLHVDRCDATAASVSALYEVVGIELASKSKVYEWIPANGHKFNKITVFQGKAIQEIPFFQRLMGTLKACLSQGSGASYFMCHYEYPATLLTAILLRLCGRRVFAIGCSKFDDYPRHLWREVLKSFFYLPYNGGIASGTRSLDYMRFLGVPARMIKPNYNAVSMARICDLSGAPPAPDGVAHHDRHFVLVARFVPKKNLTVALEAFAMYTWLPLEVFCRRLMCVEPLLRRSPFSCPVSRNSSETSFPRPLPWASPSSFPTDAAHAIFWSEPVSTASWWNPTTRKAWRSLWK